MYKITIIRGTVFCPPIKFSRKFVEDLSGIVDDYMPTIVRDNGAIPLFPAWQLISRDEKDVVVFSGEKIDLIRLVETHMDDAGLNGFARRCEEVFEKILNVTGYLCTRLAFAPSVVVSEKGSKPDALYKKLFAIREFKNEKADISSVSQIYRIIKKIGDKDIKINHLANFHVEPDMITARVTNHVRDRYVGDFDINTMINPEYMFSVNEMKQFFRITPDCFKDFYDLYQ